MFETSENTPTRLVLTIGRRANSAKISLDKTAGTARFERRLLMVVRRTTDVPLGDVVAADPVVITVYSREHYVLVKTRAGKKIWLAGDSNEASVAAAKEIRDFLGLPEPAADANPVPRSTRLMMKVVTALAVVAVVVSIGGTLIRWFTVPDCDSSTVLDTARNLLQRDSQQTVKLSDAALISENKSEKRCRVLLTVDGDTATVGYRVYKDGLSTMVQTSGLVGIDTLPPEWLTAIKNATERFLGHAADSHLSGKPPRRAQPDIGELVDLVFDASVVTGKTLAPSEIQRALDWFDLGERVGTVYVVAGTGFSDPGKMPATDTMQQRMQANVVQFADEFGRYVDFQITVLAAAARAIESVRKNSLAEDWDKSDAKAKQPNVRTDLSQTMDSDLIALAYQGYAEEWRIARIRALAAVAPVAATFLEPEQANSLRERALQVVDYQQSATVKDELRKLADLLAKP